MIEVTLRFGENLFEGWTGSQMNDFLIDMLKSNPSFSIDAAEEVTIKSRHGVVTI